MFSLRGPALTPWLGLGGAGFRVALGMMQAQPRDVLTLSPRLSLLWAQLRPLASSTGCRHDSPSVVSVGIQDQESTQK